MSPAHDEPRYVAALARVAGAEVALAAACARAVRRCACCGAEFVPTARRQRNCTDPECVRARHRREALHWEQHRAAAALESRGLGHDLRCVCGGRLWPTVCQDGTVADRCGYCGGFREVRRTAA